MTVGSYMTPKQTGLQTGHVWGYGSNKAIDGANSIGVQYSRYPPWTEHAKMADSHM